MNIGVNTLFYIPGEVGGSETYLLEILRAWKLMPIDHPVTLFTQLENDTQLREEFSGEGWKFVCCPFHARNRTVRILREQFELPRRVQRAHVDVLWSPGYTAPRRVCCPQVVSILDMQYKTFPQDLGWVARWTTEFLVQSACRSANKILTISDFSRKEILKYTKAQPQQVEVSLLAVDPCFARAAVQDEPGSGHPDSPPSILCVANTYPHKNVDQLIRAFGLIEDQVPHQLVLVGGPRRGEGAVQKALKKISAPERVIRKSGLSREELVLEYQRAALFVFPSLYEGFGLPVLEAMAAGTLVITTRCASIPEVGGEAVTYYEPAKDMNLAQAIISCMGFGASTQEALQKNAMTHAAEFSWTKTSLITLRVLEGVSS